MIAEMPKDTPLVSATFLLTDKKVEHHSINITCVCSTEKRGCMFDKNNIKNHHYEEGG